MAELVLILFGGMVAIAIVYVRGARKKTGRGKGK